MNSKVVVLGASGMLGSAFVRLWNNNPNVLFVTRTPQVLDSSLNIYRWDYAYDNISSLPKADYYINCIGLIKPFINHPIDAIYLNSVFPHELAFYASDINARLIHITTDCVFSGKQQLPYHEFCLSDAEDTYGKTKSLGETDKAMVLRTSIIGTELHKYASLMSWYFNYPLDKVMYGYTNHTWNGMTTDEYARLCEIIITKDWYSTELFHIFSPEIVTKYELLTMFENKFKRGLNIVPSEASTPVYRALGTKKDLNARLGVRPLQDQIIGGLWHG